MTTVWSSGVSMPVMVERLFLRELLEASAVTRSIEYFTSAAVSGSPEWKVTPGLQLEGVGEAVFADLVVCSTSCGLDGAGVGQLEQRFVDVAVEGLVDALAGAGGVVEVLRLVERADLDRRIGIEAFGSVQGGAGRQGADECDRGRESPQFAPTRRRIFVQQDGRTNHSNCS